MEFRIVERDGVEEAIEEAAANFFSRDRSAVEAHFVGHKEGDSSTIFGYIDDEVVGILTIRWNSRNPNLRRAGIPLIQNIEIKHGRRGGGIGNELMAHAEEFVRERADRVAICVSLSEAYGPAQRLYVKRRYVPDGQGFTKVIESESENGLVRIEPIREGEQIRVGGDILMWLIKDLK